MKNSYKILITGTTSVGKSTLLELLKKQQHPNVHIIDEIARKVLDQEIEVVSQNNPDQKPDLQDFLFAKQIQEEIHAEQSAKVTVCDRGVLDNIAHALLFAVPIKQEWIDWCQTYDKIFVLYRDKEGIPFEITDLQRKIGDRDWVKFRNDLDTQIYHALQLCRLPHEVLRGSSAEQFFAVDQEVRRHLQTPHLIEGQFRHRKEQL